jgi:hypothetical protein
MALTAAKRGYLSGIPGWPGGGTVCDRWSLADAYCILNDYALALSAGAIHSEGAALALHAGRVLAILPGAIQSDGAALPLYIGRLLALLAGIQTISGENIDLVYGLGVLSAELGDTIPGRSFLDTARPYR